MLDSDAPIDDEIPCDGECGCDLPDPDFESEIESMERNDRAWLRTLYPYVELAVKPNQAEVHTRVRHAMNDAAIAACERVARICRSDLAPVDYPIGDA